MDRDEVEVNENAEKKNLATILKQQIYFLAKRNFCCATKTRKPEQET